MKRTALILAVAMTACAAAATAQDAKSNRGSAAYFSSAEKYQTVSLKTAKDGLIEGLTAENEGVVLSSLAHASYMRIVLPAEAMTEIDREIRKLAEYGRTATVRERAALAGRVFQNPGLFSDLIGKHYVTGDEFFSDISARIMSVQL